MRQRVSIDVNMPWRFDNVPNTKKKTWKILDRGEVPRVTNVIEYHCECGVDAMLPVSGLAIAQLGKGLVFDRGPYSMCKVIQCRSCGRVLESGVEDVR